MSAYQALQLGTQVVFVVIALIVIIEAVHQPRRTTIDIALFFGVVALVVGLGWLEDALSLTPGRLLNALSGSGLISLPYLLARLVGDFTSVPARLQTLAAAGLAAGVTALIVLPPPYPGLVSLLLVCYFVGLMGYDAVAFTSAARRAGGVTRRRFQAVGAGCLALGVFILLVPVVAISQPVHWLATFWTITEQLCALTAGLCFYLGFTPPRWLRRAWQEPEVRAFLGRAASLPRLPDTEAIINALEKGAATALGVHTATVGMWDGEAGVLRYGHGERLRTTAPDQYIGGRAFISQRPLFIPDASRADAANADTYRRTHVGSVLAAPITAGNKRMGVLVVHAPNEPIFAGDDLDLVTLLADQAAVILESRALIDAAARVRAQEEAAHLKDDFLSAAAHDLKTPLTGLVGQAQLLERRAVRNPGAPADLAGIRSIVSEAMRLKRLVLELLDVARLEQGKLVSQRDTVDVAALARDACVRHGTSRHQYVLDAPDRLIGQYDETRIMQLLDNLLENASKYSPEGGDVHVQVWQDGASVRVAVTDPGIGVPESDLPSLFDRFHRGSNVDDRHFPGLGLGLFICRGIVEQQGGSIWATSAGPGLGSTFQVALPIGEPSSAAPPTQERATADQAGSAIQIALEHVP